MVLNRVDWQFFVRHAFDRIVVQVDHCHVQAGACQGIGVHRVAMVLARDVDAAGNEVFYRMVRSPVAELQFESLPAESP